MKRASNDIYRFAIKSVERADEITRKAVEFAAEGCIMRSPVGNPELWQVNSRRVLNREIYNAFVDEFNADVAAGEKRMRKATSKSNRKGFKLYVPPGYEGGRFRGNWNLGIGAPDESTTEQIDPDGGPTLAKIVSAMAGQTNTSGKSYFVTNSLPYAHRLEFEGWSTQAPNGMMRLTFTELPVRLGRYVNGAES